MRRAFRTLVIIAIVCTAVAILVVLIPALSSADSQNTPILAPGSFSAGLADLVRAPAITVALASGVGAVFVRALTWRRKPHRSAEGRHPHP
ncbi:MAG: hypothetical protein ACHP7F_04645 [Actinomycetales bacterium]|jgi:hypothetical protein|nr:hypothetical protein [Leifsonia sp.]